MAKPERVPASVRLAAEQAARHERLQVEGALIVPVMASLVSAILGLPEFSVQVSPALRAKFEKGERTDSSVTSISFDCESAWYKAHHVIEGRARGQTEFISVRRNARKDKGLVPTQAHIYLVADLYADGTYGGATKAQTSQFHVRPRDEFEAMSLEEQTRVLFPELFPETP